MTLLEEIKVVLRANINDAPCGIYGEKRSLHKSVCRLFEGGGVVIDVCLSPGCFEVLGLSDELFDEVRKYYNEIRMR